MTGDVTGGMASGATGTTTGTTTGRTTGGASYADRVARCQLVIGGIAVAVGALGLFLASDLGFTDPAGALLGWGDYELKFMAYNPLGALLTVAVGALGVAAGVTRRQPPAIAAAAISALMVVQVLVQWRPEGENLLGGSGRNLGFDLLLVVGFATTAALARVADRVDAGGPIPDGPIPDRPTPESS